MLNTGKSPTPSFHFISASRPNPNSLLLLDLTQILDALESCTTQLLESPFLSSGGEYIRPIECDRALEVLREMREAISGLTAKLRAAAPLYAGSGSSYYRLNMYLYSTGGKSRKLDEMLREFRRICMEPSSRQRQAFAGIRDAMKNTIDACERLTTETEATLDAMLMRINIA